MTMSTLAWLGMAAYAAHILEEYTFDWRNWARDVLKLPVEWSDFYVTNGVVVALGIAQAMLAPTLPLAVLSYAGLMLVNAVLAHVVQFLRTGGRFSPGLFTAVLLFAPLTLATYWTAWASGVASLGKIALGIVIGAGILAFPIAMLKARSAPYFQQAAGA